jgi:hypothetical protein
VDSPLHIDAGYGSSCLLGRDGIRIASFVKKETMDERFAEEAVEKHSPVVDNQQALHPVHVVNGKAYIQQLLMEDPPNGRTTNRERCRRLSRADTWVVINMF